MLLFDTHADTLYTRFQRPQADFDITPDRLRQGGVTVQTMALFVGGSPELKRVDETFAGALKEGAQWEAQGIRRLDDYRDCTEGEVAFIYSVEGCDLLDNSLALLSAWRGMGVRMAALTWNYENCVGVPAIMDQDAGLKPFGKEAAREMARLGIAPDTSHLSQRGFYDLLDMGIVPLASHSCCGALCCHFRNLTDHQLKALFQAGGYVGINFCPEFLRQDREADLDSVCDHVIHVMELGGAGHVGFGSDFDGIDAKPQGLSGPQDFPALLNALRRRGLSEEEIADVAGRNLLAYYDRIDPRTKG
ncbi:MAG: membrane dipeptidase [Clostridia bacterium]|nr:membrane dipeptidase [Clostridia bacterium]